MAIATSASSKFITYFRNDHHPTTPFSSPYLSTATTTTTTSFTPKLPHISSSFLNPFTPSYAHSAVSVSRRSLTVRAARGKFERKKPHVNIGTIGHVDHRFLQRRILGRGETGEIEGGWETVEEKWSGVM